MMRYVQAVCIWFLATLIVGFVVYAVYAVAVLI